MLQEEDPWEVRAKELAALQFPCEHNIPHWKRCILLEAKCRVIRETKNNWTFQCSECLCNWTLLKPEVLRGGYYLSYTMYYWSKLSMKSSQVCRDSSLQ